jgi:hypothetical protein
MDTTKRSTEWTCEVFLLLGIIHQLLAIGITESIKTTEILLWSLSSGQNAVMFTTFSQNTTKKPSTIFIKMNNTDYIPDWAVFNETADRMIENIDYLISKL